MSKGISVFLGMDYSLEDNIMYMEKAKKQGFNMIFTSLHIPEADYSKVIGEFKYVIKRAKELDMTVIADISPSGFKFLKLKEKDLKGIRDLGVDVLRIDFGFPCEDISEFTHNKYGIKIEINASTVTERFLKELESFQPNYSNMQACHNYYPRLNTGISVETFKRKNELLNKYKIELSAFIPSLVNKRGPIYEGLPTLEIHRLTSPRIAAKHLYAMGINNVLFGDSTASDDELISVGSVNEKLIEFDIEVLSNCDVEKKAVFRDFHSNRSDTSADVIRSVESRLELGVKDKINEFNNIPRKIGYVTIDNFNYLRYSGELQICKKNLPRDTRVNVVGKIKDEELFLINFIEDESKFKFKDVEQQ
ncbi:DUF871 domain-containing protein [Clostridium algidicarnis]|uniref:DUF871 domain-containing protein n=1 Tax=Clostridium algidicarnis TaxID=37659 RepID=UPI001C0D1599|nr:MupG family TIM beta-alpha barrel fold protein [Clostridium algidicarnis]MBU3196566.1 DUF871 family protein [Clostridium algidicarnis]MBU3209919.1 DUF871 family protein [Clostridium algidicarnis]MBU3228458.1 DUF871 family protein [Clostridium algidicarnis]MBU3252201.1 DUF871 family protein [Clostridium algidicarnis]